MGTHASRQAVALNLLAIRQAEPKQPAACTGLAVRCVSRVNFPTGCHLCDTCDSRVNFSAVCHLSLTCKRLMIFPEKDHQPLTSPAVREHYDLDSRIPRKTVILT